MKDIPGFEGLYAVTSCGKVWSHISKKFLKPQDNGHGYLKVNLGRSNPHYIHRLVAETYIDNSENKEFINHKDEIKAHNYVNNLEWVSRLENNNYGTRNERVAAAKRHPVYCVELDRVFDGVKIAAEELGIGRTGIGKCCLGKQKTAGGYHWRYAEEAS